MSVWHRISVRLAPPDPAPIGPFPGILDSAPAPYGPDPIVFGPPRVKNPSAD